MEIGATGSIGAINIDMMYYVYNNIIIRNQGLSQNVDTGWPKFVKFWGVLFFKGAHNLLRFQHVFVQ